MYLKGERQWEQVFSYGQMSTGSNNVRRLRLGRRQRNTNISSAGVVLIGNHKISLRGAVRRQNELYAAAFGSIGVDRNRVDDV